MPTNKNYMYGQEANFGILTNKPERESYWDYMARRGAGAGSINKNEALAKEELSNLWNNLPESTQSNPSNVIDSVNHPPHYNKGIETTQYIKSWEMNWNQANVVKYVSRYNLKNKNNVSLQIQDLMKAKWYLDDLIKELEKHNPY